MVREIVHDPLLLGRKSSPAGEGDIRIADDLMDTLKANSDACVGMAANMIGELKSIIVFCDGKAYIEMFNPEIISASGKYEAEEGCLSLSGVHKAVRYRKIKVRWQNRQLRTTMRSFEGFTAQIIQHELDHCNGILV